MSTSRDRRSVAGKKVDLVLPAHNEEHSIEEVIRDFYDVCAVRGGLDLRFIISEDGSSDNTAQVIERLASELPITLIHTDFRKGYSRAVVDGLRASTAPLVATCDSDGQYESASLLDLVAAIEGHQVAYGYRNPRNDPGIRKVMSGAFKLAYEAFQKGRFRDPSCPFDVFTREALEILVLGNSKVPLMPQGLWWEVSARIAGLEMDVVEVPVSHRKRDEGGSVVYKPKRIPRIVADNLFGLWLTKGDIDYQRTQLGL
jgi:glycosyltransferase involved in cell wall biosynthesis